MTYDSHGDLDAILNGADALLGEDGVLTPTRAVSGEPLLVLVTNFELLLVLEGHELTFAAEGGARVRVRLYTTDELLSAQEDVISALPEGAIRPRRMTRAQAYQLCHPVDVEAIARMRGSS